MKHTFTIDELRKRATFYASCVENDNDENDDMRDAFSLCIDVLTRNDATRIEFDDIVRAFMYACDTQFICDTLNEMKRTRHET